MCGRGRDVVNAQPQILSHTLRRGALQGFQEVEAATRVLSAPLRSPLLRPCCHRGGSTGKPNWGLCPRPLRKGHSQAGAPWPPAPVLSSWGCQTWSVWGDVLGLYLKGDHGPPWLLGTLGTISLVRNVQITKAFPLANPTPWFQFQFCRCHKPWKQVPVQDPVSLHCYLHFIKERFKGEFSRFLNIDGIGFVCLF